MVVTMIRFGVALWAVVFSCFSLAAQTGAGEAAFDVKGDVTVPQRFGESNFEKFPPHALGDLAVTQGSGVTDSLTDAEGVRLRDVLKDLKSSLERGQTPGDVYFVCRGADGFVNVFSWFEIFDDPGGKSIYVVLRAVEGNDGGKVFSLLSPSGLGTGYRMIAILKEVEVRRASFKY